MSATRESLRPRPEAFNVSKHDDDDEIESLWTMRDAPVCYRKDVGDELLGGLEIEVCGRLLEHEHGRD